jgi:hypothetical protein
MTFRGSIYAGGVLFCMGKRQASCELGPSTKSSGDLHYIVAGIALLVSGGIGVVASQIVVAFGPRFHSIGGHVKQRSALPFFRQQGRANEAHSHDASGHPSG